jgi:serine/threonine protein kinase
LIGAGTVLGERYRLDSRIAIGGMGEVWRAQDETLGRTVAVKVLKPEYAEDPSFVERFRAEARNTARLAHSGIATVYDYGEVPVDGAVGSSAYLVMELVPGQPLSMILRERGPLSPSETMSIIGQTALALQAAHERGVIHRDVKPGNLMITPDGRVKVTDFGIARATDEIPLTQTGTVLGTSYYLAPEQAAGREVTAASDVYSLGIVAYECLAGRRPFQDTNPVAVALAHQTEPPPPLPSNVPPPIAAVVYAALSKSPRDRPPTAGEFGRRCLALADPEFTAASAPPTGVTERLRTGVVPPVAPPPIRQPPPGPPPKRKIPISVPLIGLLVLAAVLLTILLLRNSDSSGGAKPSATPSATATSASPTPSETPSQTPSPTESPSPTPSPTPDTVNLNPADYIGRTLSSVQTSLGQKGFSVTVSGSLAPGAKVIAINPSGVQKKGSSITVLTETPTTAPPTTPPPTTPPPSPSASLSSGPEVTLPPVGEESVNPGD